MSHQITLTKQEQFFYDHAGWSHDPQTETSDNGRIRAAILLASAERTLAHSVAEVIWEQDTEPYDGDVPYDGPMWCAFIVKNGEILTSLSGIAMQSLDEPYKRVIEAELALDVL